MKRLLAIALTAWVVAMGLPAQEADSSRECAICHLSWMPTFLHGDRDGDLCQMPESAVVNSEDVCFSCHDGSIVDSRSRVFLEHGHRTGVELTDDMTIPEHLPLDNGNRLTCGTCHTAHGVNPHSEAGRISFFMRIPNENSELCMTCHTAKTEHLAGRNHPVDVNLDGEWPAEFESTLSVRGHDFDVVCQSCHTPHGQRDEHLLVLPTQQSALCMPCHTDQVPQHEGDWATGHPIDVSITSEADAAALRAVGIHLEADGELGCLSCHSTHSGQADAGILVADNSQDAMCLECHSNKEELMGSSHHLATTAPGLVNAAGRPADRAGSCSGCHVPHNAQGPMLWSREVEGDGGEAAMCLSCHGEAHTGGVTALTGGNHPTGIALTDEMSAGALPLFDAALHPSVDGTMVCSTCHTVHTDGVGNGLRVSNEGDQLCQTCHTDAWNMIADGAHSMGMDQSLCSSCHTPHNATGPRLWPHPLSAEGAMPAEQMCATCHSDPHWSEANTRGTHIHPTAGSFGGEAPSDLPLFDRETLERGSDGDMTCLTCHDAHHVPQQTGEITRVTASGDSQLCQECHADQSEEILGTGHGVIMSQQDGVCANCHQFLNTDGTGRRFHAQSETEDSDTITASCLVCHDSEGQNLLAHPLASASELDVATHLPLFDGTGARQADGHMNCATCHDPHGMGSEVGALLRPAEGEDLCLDCHRDQSAIVGTDHDLQEELGGATVCTSCHTAHPSGDHPLLWAGPLGQGNSFMEQTCTGCHRERGEARPVPATTPTHPPEAIMFWAEDAGPVDCGTCHDAHRWTAMDGADASPADEGTIMTSFLRNDVAAESCAPCHGRDAMVRHLLFHQGQRWGHSPLVPQEDVQ